MDELTWKLVHETLLDIKSYLEQGECTDEFCSVAFLTAEDLIEKIREAGKAWEDKP